MWQHLCQYDLYKILSKINKYKKTNSRENGYMQETNRTQVFIALIIATFNGHRRDDCQYGDAENR